MRISFGCSGARCVLGRCIETFMQKIKIILYYKSSVEENVPQVRNTSLQVVLHKKLIFGNSFLNVTWICYRVSRYSETTNLVLFILRRLMLALFFVSPITKAVCSNGSWLKPFVGPHWCNALDTRFCATT
jgi:hypothetical protein